jgi:hypothetical protein
LNHFGKATINRDLSTEAVQKTTSVNTICPPRLNFSVVVSTVMFYNLFEIYNLVLVISSPEVIWKTQRNLKFKIIEL